MHQLSSITDNPSSNNSKNNILTSFIDENDENVDHENTTIRSIDAETFEEITETPKKEAAIENTDETKTNQLSLSFMVMTSYVAPNNDDILSTPKPKGRIASINVSPANTPTPNVASSPSTAAFQTIDQNENALNKSNSFAMVKPPATPIGHRAVNKSMHLIDLSTPENELQGSPNGQGVVNKSMSLIDLSSPENDRQMSPVVVASSSHTFESKSRNRLLLSAIKNSALKSARRNSLATETILKKPIDGTFLPTNSSEQPKRRNSSISFVGQAEVPDVNSTGKL